MADWLYWKEILACDGCVVKTAGADEYMAVYSLAKVFDSYEAEGILSGSGGRRCSRDYQPLVPEGRAGQQGDVDLTLDIVLRLFR